MLSIFFFLFVCAWVRVRGFYGIENTQTLDKFHIIGLELGIEFMLLEERRSLVEITTKKLKNYLVELYQDELDQVILFGSEARGEAEIDSDVDILIVLKNSFNYFDEIKKISGFISDLCLDYELYLSCCFATSKKWNLAESGFYRNVRKDGIEL